MPDKDVKLGSTADNPTDPNSPAAAPDMNRYYYPPGTTEPVLRPEFANQPDPKAATADAPEEPESKTKPSSDASAPQSAKRPA